MQGALKLVPPCRDFPITGRKTSRLSGSCLIKGEMSPVKSIRYSRDKTNFPCYHKLILTRGWSRGYDLGETSRPGKVGRFSQHNQVLRLTRQNYSPTDYLDLCVLFYLWLSFVVFGIIFIYLNLKGETHYRWRHYFSFRERFLPS